MRQLIADLRGGIPDKCDVCGKETPPDDLDPVSGGEWICGQCWEAELDYFRQHQPTPSKNPQSEF